MDSKQSVAQDSPPALPGEVWRGSDGESPGTVAIAGDPAAPDMGFQAWWFDALRGRWRVQSPALAAVIFRAWALSLRAELEAARDVAHINLGGSCPCGADPDAVPWTAGAETWARVPASRRCSVCAGAERDAIAAKLRAVQEAARAKRAVDATIADDPEPPTSARVPLPILPEEATLCACSCSPCRTGDHAGHSRDMGTARCPAGDAAEYRWRMDAGAVL